MDASAERRLTSPFVVGEGELRRIDEMLRGLSTTPTYTISCADGVSRQFADLDALLKFENPPPRAIQSLVVSTHYSKGPSFRLRLDSDRYSNISGNIEGDETNVLRMKEMLDDFVLGTRPGYAPFARLNYFWPALGAVMLIYLSPFMAALWRANRVVLKGTEVPPRELILSSVRGMLIGLTPMFLGWLLNHFRDRVFPFGVFLIGQGSSRHRQMEVVRLVFIAGAAISVVSSLVVAWMLSR